MKINILFLLKLRNYVFKLCSLNRHYSFDSTNSVTLMEDQHSYDTDSLLILNYFYKNCKADHVYFLKNIDKFKMKLILCKYSSKSDAVSKMEFQNKNCKFYINNNLITTILFACAFRDKYFIFSSFPRQDIIKYDPTNNVHEELKAQFIHFEINIDRLWLCTNILKYIKLKSGYKITKYYPLYINL